MAGLTVGPRIARLRHRVWHACLRRGNSLRFLPNTAGDIAALLQDAGFSDAGFPRSDAEPGAELRRADDVVWKAAQVGTPPQGNMTLDLDGFERLTHLRSWDRRPVAGLVSSLLNAHIATRRSCLGDPAFWRRALEIVRRVGAPYLVIGDSHSLCSCIVGGSARRPTIPIHILCTAGSATGLDNPASLSGYGVELARLAEALRVARCARDLPILFQFGQVDVEFVSVFHRVHRSETMFDRARFEAFCDKAIQAYGAFLAKAFAGFDSLHVLSIFPPALADVAWAEGYTNAHVASLEGDRDAEALTAQLRAIAIPSLIERTALHRHFNDRLRTMCRNGRRVFVDVFDRFIGRDGTLAPRFNRYSSGLNHHLCIPAARKVIRPATERIARGMPRVCR